MKHHLYRVASNSLLTFEEFDRLTAKIEAVLNSRPLTAISNNPSDLSTLTAGHFLIGRPLIAKPDRDLTRLSGKAAKLNPQLYIKNQFIVLKYVKAL